MAGVVGEKALKKEIVQTAGNSNYVEEQSMYIGEEIIGEAWLASNKLLPEYLMSSIVEAIWIRGKIGYAEGSFVERWWCGYMEKNEE